MSVPYRHPRGTKAALDGLAAANGLLIGQVYFLTDEQRLVVAHAVNAYTPLAKQSEISSGGDGGGIVLEPHDFWQDTWFSANGATSPDRWTGAAMGSTGTNSTAIPATSIGGKFRHGVFLRSSANADSGYRYQTSSLVGDTFGQVSHKFACVFKWLTAFTARTVRTGFHDTNTVADATDGAYFEIIGSTCSAKTANNGTRTTNATTLTLSLNIPYVFDIEVNAAGTEARFRVFNGDTGESLMDVTNTTNIPTTTARSFGSGITATFATSAANDIGILYYLGEGTINGYLAAGGNATGLGLSTVAEIQALTGTGAIGAANLATAAAYDTVTGINEFNPLWDEFISAYVESDVSSVTFEFNNPVSVIPGTSRVVYLAVGAGATTRSVVWGSDYITPPAISVPGSGFKIFRVVLEATPFLNLTETGPLIYVSATELAVEL